METVTGEDGEDSDDLLTPSDDILAAQLKFTACLKIVTNELRTLSTGYELDGGKLRYQLYQWLEREVIAHTFLNTFANFKVRSRLYFCLKYSYIAHLWCFISLAAP